MLVGIVAVVAAACGGGADPPSGPARSVTGTVSTTVSPSVTVEPSKDPPTELRVAYINLLSPVSVDANDRTADETFDARLNLIIEELKTLNPDIIGVSEATVTTAHGSALEKLTAGLKMEYKYLRANPWFPGQSKEQNDELWQQIGFQEGDAIFSRYPILSWDQVWLNPRTSETEGRALLHVVIKLPDPFPQTDVFITHLTGGGERVRTQQATDAVAAVKRLGGAGPWIVMGDLSDAPDSTTAATFAAAGMHDVAIVAAGEPGYGTCCRESVVKEQPPLTQRYDYIFAERLVAPAVSVFGDQPKKRADGSLLYASDHNGLLAVFPLNATATPP
ncbi:hypothetical protein AYO38_05220 [bacterium SCGC AG-212-C10]|nr:hypothetical protein AYO38_05220 [bacterium SCGC AG-212-C10]